MSGDGPTARHYEPPGPGSWNLDPVHFPRPVTRYFAEMHPEPFRRGTREFMAYYGTPMESIEMQYVNGFAYSTMRPAPDDEIPQRFARAEEVWERKVWRDQLREWDESAKPAAIAIDRELQSVDADALSDDELVAYLTRCREHHSQMIYQHMRFTGSAMLPVGDLLAHLGSWTGVARADALAMMRGAAPVSAGASGELERLIAAITQDTAARALLDSDGDPGKTLAELRAFDGDVGTAMSQYLDLVGCRLLDGFDISGRYALELPDALLRAIRLSVDGARATRRTSTRASPASARRCPSSTGPSSTSCSARRASCTGCATNAASSATSGHPASCAAPRSRPVAGSRARAASTTPSTSSTPASTRCVRS